MPEGTWRQAQFAVNIYHLGEDGQLEYACAHLQGLFMWNACGHLQDHVGE